MVELSCTGIAAGGDAIARAEDGRVVFVQGAIPGERVQVEITQNRKDFQKATVRSVIDPSPDRIAPVCPHVADGCGGCDWAFINEDGQRSLKEHVVVDALRRLGKIAEPQALVSSAGPLATTEFRTTVRAGVANGRAGYRASGSHRLVHPTTCRVLHPVLERLLVEGSFGGANEVRMRIAPASGDVVITVDPVAGGVVIPDGIVSGRLSVVGIKTTNGGELASASRFIRERINGVELHVSAPSFFQTRTDGAEALVRLVDEAIGPDHSDLLIDLYGGVGLFAATIGRRFAAVVSVERDGPSSFDAETNLRTHPNALAVAADVDEWRLHDIELFDDAESDDSDDDDDDHDDEADFDDDDDDDEYDEDDDDDDDDEYDDEEDGGDHNRSQEPDPLDDSDIVVIADPSRAGLGPRGVQAIVSCRPSKLVLVSCDPASLGRDTKLLHDIGLELQSSVLVDLFPHTSHVEVVSTFLPKEKV